MNPNIHLKEYEHQICTFTYTLGRVFSLWMSSLDLFKMLSKNFYGPSALINQSINQDISTIINGLILILILINHNIIILLYF